MADFSSLLGAAGIGGAIGKAIVSLELETTKYQAELKAAQAQTATGTQAMGSGFSKFGSLASTALLGVGAAAVAGAAFSIKAAVEANDAHLKLTNTFENNNRLADSSVEAFERQADALRDLTGVDDEAIVTSQALLGQFKITGEQVQELTPLVVDLSEKMGIDLTAAAKSVGKAVIGNTAGLQRYGIVIEEASGAGGEFDAVLQGLQGTVGGFAEQRAINEPWRVLGAQFEELAEQIGQALLPILNSIVPVVQDLVQAMGPLLDLIGKLGPAVGFLGEAFTFLLSPLAKVLSLLDGGFQPTEEMVTLMGSAVVELQSMKAKADLAADGLYNFTSGAIEAGDAIKETGKQVKEFAGMTGEELKEWRLDTKETFRTAIFQLQDFTAETDITKRDVIQAFREMKQDARDFARAMEDLPKGKWVNEEFIQFISDQGPEWIIGFSQLNKEKQKSIQEDWEESGRTFNRSIKGSFLDLNDTLDRLDNKTTKHTVEVHYKYVDFDPSKPGMQPSGQRGGQI